MVAFASSLSARRWGSIIPSLGDCTVAKHGTPSATHPPTGARDCSALRPRLGRRVALLPRGMAVVQVRLAPTTAPVGRDQRRVFAARVAPPPRIDNPEEPLLLHPEGGNHHEVLVERELNYSSAVRPCLGS